MLLPEEQLRNISLDEEVYDVLRTPNRLRSGVGEFEGWEDTREHPCDSPERRSKLHPVKKPNSINKLNAPFFRLYTTQHSTSKTLNIQNKQNFSISPFEMQKTMKIMQLIDEQVLSPQSRKIITPNYIGSQKYSQKFCTPKSSHRTRDISLRKICNTERLRKSEKQTMNTTTRQSINKKQTSNEDLLKFNDHNLLMNRGGQINKQDSFKIPLSAIQYPVLKLNNKRPVRRLQRFQSFVARTVRK